MPTLEELLGTNRPDSLLNMGRKYQDVIDQMWRDRQVAGVADTAPMAATTAEGRPRVIIQTPPAPAPSNYPVPDQPPSTDPQPARSWTEDYPFLPRYEDFKQSLQDINRAAAGMTVSGAEGMRSGDPIKIGLGAAQSAVAPLLPLMAPIGAVGETLTKAAGRVGPGLAHAFDVASWLNPETAIGPVSKLAPAVAAIAPIARKTARVAEEVTPLERLPSVGHNNPPPDIQGSLNPLANKDIYFRGKQPAQFTPEDWKDFGEHYGTKDIGPLSPLQTFKDAQGNEFQLPGGTEGKWTYYDLLHMKANPINPANVDRALHTEMQRKLGRTMTPENLSDSDVWNGLIFGMTSPNNPLFPNQVTASRMRLRTPEMLDDLASMVPWKPGDIPTKEARKIVNDQVAARYGLDAGSKGGLGTRGTADYSRVAEMAQLFKQNPEFFRKKPDESWTQAVERISSQLPGLSMKTGSFGTVWQNPADAAISAIDRHMARELDKRGGIFETPKERADWENRSVNLWNKREADRVVEQTKEAKEKGSTKEIAPADKATDFDDMLSKSGSDGFIGEMLLDHVGKALTPKFRMAKGEINPKIPDHLAKADWVKEPETVFKVGKAYKQALEVNQKIADEHGLNLFMSQWMEWDRIRNRFEPHENMFPGLSNLPAMSLDQLRSVDRAHAQTGHKTYGKTEEGTLQPTRPLSGSASQMGYLGLGGAALLPGLQEQDRE